MTIIQATEVIQQADKYSDKYGLTTVLLVAFCILLLLAVWKVILPMFKEAQTKYEAAMKAQLDQQKEQTRDFLKALKEIEDSHKDVADTIMNTIKTEREKGDRR
jgi:F0F1-type ATP synthase membrane subunit b/b'